MDLQRHHRILHGPVTASAINILDDLLIMEVLVRLMMKSVVRFKRVQKSWLGATKDAWFVRRHLMFSHVMTPDVLIALYIDDAKVELMLGATKQKVITLIILPTHCDGLVAIANNNRLDDEAEQVWSQHYHIDVFLEQIGTNGFFPVVSRCTEFLIPVDNEKFYQWYDWSETMLKEVNMGKDLDHERQDGSKLTCCELGLALYHVVPYMESLVSIRE
uniref:F-box domain-containing protein n=1 Tax=Oryza punctata TaxID=4537 RepID=A0A0E0KPR6_ORYPU